MIIFRYRKILLKNIYKSASSFILFSRLFFQLEKKNSRNASERNSFHKIWGKISGNIPLSANRALSLRNSSIRRIIASQGWSSTTPLTSDERERVGGYNSLRLLYEDHLQEIFYFLSLFHRRVHFFFRTVRMKVKTEGEGIQISLQEGLKLPVDDISQGVDFCGIDEDSKRRVGY